MSRQSQDPEALLASLVQATRAMPTAAQAERVERRLSPWLGPKPGFSFRPLYAVNALIAIVGIGLLLQPYSQSESASTIAKRVTTAPVAAPRATLVRHETPMAAEKARIEMLPASIAVTTKAPAPPPMNAAPVEPSASATDSVPAELGAPAPVEQVAPPPAPTRREPEVDFLRRAQGALVSSPSEALRLAGEHPSLYPRGILVQEREVIAIDALARLGRRADAAARAEAFRASFPRSAHLSRLAALTEKP